MGIIIDHTNRRYQRRLSQSPETIRYNGAYYYSIEIVNNIIPFVETDRNWVTINTSQKRLHNSIIFIHNNKYPKRYEWVKTCKNSILVCGIPETVSTMETFGTPIYLPLSIDIEEVERFKVKNKTKKIAFIGRYEKRKGILFGKQIDSIMNIPRSEFLTKVAQYEAVYAVGRCALEAKVLGCEVLPYDPRFPDPTLWQVLDNKDAAIILQKEIDKIDKRGE